MTFSEASTKVSLKLLSSDLLIKLLVNHLDETNINIAKHSYRPIPNFQSTATPETNLLKISRNTYLSDPWRLWHWLSLSLSIYRV